MQERAKPQIDIEINPQASGKWAIVISLIALVFSAISLYESLLRQPHVTLNTAGTWLYARGEATEELSVPLTLTNSGAREATVLSIELILSKRSERKTFRSLYVSNGAPDSRSLLTPIPIAGRSSFSGILIFTPVVSGSPLVDAAGDYAATIHPQSTFVRSFGRLDDLLSPPDETLKFAARLNEFPIAEVIGRRKPVIFEVTAERQ